MSALKSSILVLIVASLGCGQQVVDFPNSAPKVSSTIPGDTAIGVSVGSPVSATFDRAMNTGTMIAANFELKQGTTVAGIVSYSGTTMTLIPSVKLLTSMTYTATVSVGAQDTNGNALAQAHKWTFTTAATSGDPASDPPTVVSTIPLNGAVGVPLNVKATATFSKAMDPATITGTSFTLAGAAPISGVVSYAAVGTTGTFAPGSSLTANTTYTATVTTGATDTAGKALDASHVWTFTTGTTADTTPPTVTSTSPANLDIGVSINRKVTATFSKAMDPLTLTTSTFKLAQGATPITGAVSYAAVGTIATFIPANPLVVNTTYTATITTGAKDLAGNALASDHVWTFTTAACSQGPVNLGSAAGFAVLASTTVTSTGPTVVNGNLGVSPGTAVVGFGNAPGVAGPGTVNGSQFTGVGSAAFQAQADLTVAYNDVAGRTLCPVTVAGNLGGQTLPPGLYKSTSSLAVSSGDLTLDAQGEPDAMFIFQMASTLDTTPGRAVILSGGAKASNVFWQVGSSATIDTTSAFVGTVMAHVAITLKTGATLNGRTLAATAAVSLDSNTVSIPAN